MSLSDLDKKAPPKWVRGPDVFPHYYMMFSTTGGQVDSSGGLSLRDLFAGLALHGMLTQPAHHVVSFDGMASAAYEFADSMLAARETA